jgi:hypothetical protein
VLRTPLAALVFDNTLAASYPDVHTAASRHRSPSFGPALSGHRKSAAPLVAEDRAGRSWEIRHINRA